MTIMRCLQRQERNKLIVRNVLFTLYHFEVPGDFVSLILDYIFRPDRLNGQMALDY